MISEIKQTEPIETIDSLKMKYLLNILNVADGGGTGRNRPPRIAAEIDELVQKVQNLALTPFILPKTNLKSSQGVQSMLESYATNNYRLVWDEGHIAGLERKWIAGQLQKEEWRHVDDQRIPPPAKSAEPQNAAPSTYEVANGFRRSRMREMVWKRFNGMVDKVVDDILKE